MCQVWLLDLGKHFPTIKILKVPYKILTFPSNVLGLVRFDGNVNVLYGTFDIFHGQLLTNYELQAEFGKTFSYHKNIEIFITY